MNRPEPADRDRGRLEERSHAHEAIYEPARPTRPPTPDDFYEDLREGDPLRRFRF